MFACAFGYECAHLTIMALYISIQFAVYLGMYIVYDMVNDACFTTGSLCSNKGWFVVCQ